MCTRTSYLTHTCYTQTSCCTLIYCLITKCKCWSTIIILPTYTITCCVSISCSICSLIRCYTYCRRSCSTCVTLHCPYIYRTTYCCETLNCSITYSQICLFYSIHRFTKCSRYCICLILITCSISITCYTYTWRYCINSTY